MLMKSFILLHTVKNDWLSFVHFIYNDTHWPVPVFNYVKSVKVYSKQ